MNRCTEAFARFRSPVRLRARSHRALALWAALACSVLAVGATSPVPATPEPGHVQIPVDVYDTLVKQASDPASRPAPAGWALGAAVVTVDVVELDGRATGTVRARVALEVLEDEWVLVPVLPSGTPVESVTVDGAPVQLIASPQGLAWATNRHGSYAMVLSYKIDAVRSAGGSTLAVPLPRAAAIALTATLPHEDLDAAVIPAAGIDVANAGGKTVLRATVPTADGVQITWRARDDRASTISRASYRGELVGEAVVWSGELEVELFRDTAEVLQLLPGSVTLSGLSIDGKPATILVEDGRFATRIQGKGVHEVSVAFETPVVRDQGPPRVDFEVPPIPVSRFEVVLPGKKELTVEPSANVTAETKDGATVAVAHVPMTGRVTLRWSEALPEDMGEELRANATIYHTVYADEGVLFARAHVVYEITRGETNVLELLLPDAVQINRVESASGAVADWRIADAADGARLLTVFLDRAVRDEMALDVFYDRSLRREAADEPFAVPLLRAKGVHRQRGMLALLSSNELTLTPVDEGDATRVGENQLPPFVRETIEMTVAHTFKYTEAPPLLSVRASEPEHVEGKFDARIDTLVSLGDVALTGSSAVDVHVKSGSLMELHVELPRDVNLLSLTAPSMRAYKVAEDGDAQLVNVAFTQEMEGSFRIDLTYERILGEERSRVDVPTPAVRGAEVEQGRIAVEALTAVEVDVAASERLTPVDIDELPQQLILRTTNPILLAFKYVHAVPPPRLALAVEHHRVLDVQEAAIDSAQYKTLFTADGYAVTVAEFAVRNSRKQFLEVRLPAGSEVWSAFVDGKPEKPAAASGPEADAGAVMIKIVHSTRPFSVHLVYATRGDRLRGLGRIEGVLPDPDILVTRSRWDVFLPVDFAYGAPRSNMDVVASNGVLTADEIRKELAGADRAAAPHVAVEPLRITVPSAGRHFAFEKLYANQAQDRARFAIRYASRVGAAVANGSALAGTVLGWVGVGLLLFGRRRAAGACMVGAGGTILAVSIGLAAAAPPPLVVSVAAVLTLAAIHGRRLLPLHRRVDSHTGGAC